MYRSTQATLLQPNLHFNIFNIGRVISHSKIIVYFFDRSPGIQSVLRIQVADQRPCMPICCNGLEVGPNTKNLSTRYCTDVLLEFITNFAEAISEVTSLECP